MTIWSPLKTLVSEITDMHLTLMQVTTQVTQVIRKQINR